MGCRSHQQGQLFFELFRHRPSIIQIPPGSRYCLLEHPKNDTREKWESVLQLYNRLLKIEYSPIAALNRTYALSKANGKPEAIKEAEKAEPHW